jgi:arginase family enzyme
MRPALVHLDGSLQGQPNLCAQVSGLGGSALDYRDLGPALRLWSRPHAIAQLRRRLGADLPAAFGPVVVFMGSGDFHHVTLLLLERACAALGDAPVTVVHFDNHPDWVCFGPGVHCGSWVGRAARLPNVQKVVTVGVCSRDIQGARLKEADLSLIEDQRLELYPYEAPDHADAVSLCGRRWPTIEAIGEADFAQFLPSRIDTQAIYVTIDKDVLRPQDAGTNWDQGRTSLALLAGLVRAAAAGRTVVGLDVVGDWSSAVYGGGLLAGLLKRGEAMLDQPWLSPSPAALSANETANLELLRLTAEFDA